MIFGKQKNSHPYVNLAVFSLAAAGIISIANKMKGIVKDKADCVMGFFKK